MASTRLTAGARASQLVRWHRSRMAGAESPTDFAPIQWSFIALVLGALLWSYWSTLEGLFREWQRDPNYSVGQLVPFAAIYMLWQDRRGLRETAKSPSWWGVAVILAAQAMRAYGLLFLYESAERYSLILTVAGLVLLLFGWPVVRRTGWVLLFLLLMIPLPGKVHNMLSGPLQGLATSGAVFALELFGVSVVREGHIMILNGQVPIAVAEACSGLRMLTAFVVVGGVLAYVVARPRMHKCALVLSTIPVAIICNLARLVATAILFLTVSGEFAERFFHDFAGWTMMPLAIAMLALELWVMGRLQLSDDVSCEESEMPQTCHSR